jgi:hypothetical protein
LPNRVQFLFPFSPEFSRTAIIETFNSGLFQNEAFWKSLDKRIFQAVGQQNIDSSCVIDVQPIIREVLFEIIYGKR